MADKKANKKELKALEELIKGVNMGISAYYVAAEEVADSKLRKQYASFRNTHERQLRRLQVLYEERGGDVAKLDQHSPLEAIPIFKQKATGSLPSYKSAEDSLRGEGMGIKNITDHIGDVDDDAADVLAKHLQENQEIVQWLHNYQRNVAEEHGGGLPAPLLLIVGLLAAFLVFLLRDQDEDDDDDILREEYLAPVSQG